VEVRVLKEEVIWVSDDEDDYSSPNWWGKYFFPAHHIPTSHYDKYSKQVSRTSPLVKGKLLHCRLSL